MKTFYYYIDSDGATQGPVDIDYFKESSINSRSWVWYEGLPQWVEAYSVPEIRAYIKDDLSVSFSTKKESVDLSKEKDNTPNRNIMSSADMDALRSRMPKTWLFESVIITILLCIPLGIIGVIYGSRVTSFWNRGLYAESITASNKAGFWVRLTIMISVVLWLISIAVWFFTPVAENAAIWYNSNVTETF